MCAASSPDHSAPHRASITRMGSVLCSRSTTWRRVEMTAGHLYGLGVGPGDPELLTLKALRLLRAAPVVAYPAPDVGPSFARGIVAEWLDRGQREIAIRFPMRPGPPPDAVYDEAAVQLAALLDRGEDIAFLCQGDPLFYGSFAGIF